MTIFSFVFPPGLTVFDFNAVPEVQTPPKRVMYFRTKIQGVHPLLLFILVTDDILCAVVGCRIVIPFSIFPRFRHRFSLLLLCTILQCHTQCPSAFYGPTTHHRLVPSSNVPVASRFRHRTASTPASDALGQIQIGCEASTGWMILCPCQKPDHFPQSVS